MKKSDIEEAEKIEAIITDLDKYITAIGNKPELHDIYDDTAELRNKLKSDLVDLKTHIRVLEGIDETDFYGTDPALAGRRIIEIKEIEKIKINIELDVYPKVVKITEDLLIKKDVIMPKVPEADKEDIIQKTNDLLDNANRTASIVKKGIKLVAALKSIVIAIGIVVL